jgi:hypothetical protein
MFASAMIRVTIDELQAISSSTISSGFHSRRAGGGKLGQPLPVVTSITTVAYTTAVFGPQAASTAKSA